MEKKTQVIITLSISVLLVIFGISYNIALNKYRTKVNNEKLSSEAKDEALASISTLNDLLPADVDIILKLKVLENEKELLVKKIKVEDLKNVIYDKLTLKNIESYFNKNNYKLFANSPKEIVFLKESKFEPDKYYMGITSDGYLAIFKCNYEGVLFLEDTISDKSTIIVEDLSDNDRELIENFQIKYDNKEEALMDLEQME
jgi:hypothetical protein